MTLIDRGIVTWSGWPGGPGYTVMYATPGGSFMSAIHDFFVPFNDFLPAGVRLDFPSSGDTIESTTGDLAGTWTGTTLTSIIGLDPGPYSSAQGAHVNWLTSTIVPSRGPSGGTHRLRGGTFCVPMAPTTFDTSGTLSTGVLTVLRNKADALVTAGAGHFVIWQRPTPGGSDGRIGNVTSSRVIDKTAVLRSRRD